jgi:acid phosphatase (class A)
MDTIIFPWSEYSQNALTNSLVRTVYLSKEDEAKLPGLIKALLIALMKQELN